MPSCSRCSSSSPRTRLRISRRRFHVALQGLNDQFVERLGATLFLLFGAVGLLLVIGCGNVSILLLARGTARRHELAVRAAMGAGRGRIVRQLLTESLQLAIAGAVLGALLAYQGVHLIVKWLPENSFPHEAAIGINLPVLAFSVALALATGVLFGLSPALHLSRPDLAGIMRASTRRMTAGVRGKRIHGFLVAAQVALTLLLLASAGGAIRGFVRLMHTNLGYDPHNTMLAPIPVHDNTYMTWESRAQYFEQLRARIAAMPEVVSAGISTNATPPSNGWNTHFEILGKPVPEERELRTNFVSPEYFTVLRIPWCRAACSTMRKPCAARGWRWSIRPWHTSIGPLAERSGSRFACRNSKASRLILPPLPIATAGYKSWVWSRTRVTTVCGSR